MAEIQGRLGAELLTIEVTGSLEEGLNLRVEQLITKALEERSPIVRLWRYTTDGDLAEDTSGSLDIDPDIVPVATVSNDTYQLKSHQIHLDLETNSFYFVYKFSPTKEVLAASLTEFFAVIESVIEAEGWRSCGRSENSI